MTLWRKFTVLCLAVTLCLTTVGCGGGQQQQVQTNSPVRNTSQNAPSAKLNDGKYPVQQASFDDGSGEYTLFLLNNNPPTFKTENLQMARLTDEQIKAGEKPYLQVQNGQPSLYLTEDFKIAYVHNVTETQTNPQTGQQETVVVRQESNFWAPFAGSVAGSLAGQAIGSLLFRPQYYVPPVYQPGGVITGYGGYGRTYGDAVQSYRTRYNAPPAVERNRTAFRTTGGIRNRSDRAVRSTPRTNVGNRSTGSGYGSSTLRQSGRSTTTRQRSSSGFGSGGRSSGVRRSAGGFGSRRR